MKNILDHSFLPEKYLDTICAIPHESCHEKPLSDYLVAFAKEHNLRYKQYPNWNVIIYKPASAGYEDHEPVMLQAHIDMVCEKDPGVMHDFSKDPLSLYIENGFLRARGTTLGADDGVGVAYMLAFLDDDTLPHPPLECVFTVQEEVGLIGSKELAFEDITAKRMIGLDDMGGDTCYVSACGSQRIFMNRQYTTMPNTAPGFCLHVDGLLGGHSGVCINKERGNAMKITSRVLHKLLLHTSIQIGSISGGGKDNAIPTFCETVFSCDASFDLLNSTIMQMNKVIQTELEFSDADVTITLSEAACPNVLSAKDSSDLIRFLLLLPDGFRHKSMAITNLTTVSENLANIQLQNGDLKIRYFTRSELTSYLEMMADEICTLSEIYGLQVELADPEPGWKYEEHSKIREALFASYYEITGKHMTPIAEHGGLETGFISGGIPGIDIVTCGPYCIDYHTPKEALDLASFRTIYEVLRNTLKTL